MYNLCTPYLRSHLITRVHSSRLGALTARNRLSCKKNVSTNFFARKNRSNNSFARKMCQPVSSSHLTNYICLLHIKGFQCFRVSLFLWLFVEKVDLCLRILDNTGPVTQKTCFQNLTSKHCLLTMVGISRPTEAREEIFFPVSSNLLRFWYRFDNLVGTKVKMTEPPRKNLVFFAWLPERLCPLRWRGSLSQTCEPRPQCCAQLV